MTNFEKVGLFMTTFGQEVKKKSGLSSDKINNLRINLIEEELIELKDAVNNKDIREVADALTDILYVTYGAGHAFGINLDDCFEEVQKSNMSKLGKDGKPIYNAIVWQDRRSAAYCETLAQRRYPAGQADGQDVAELIQHTTGLIIDPYFSSTKLAWLLDQTDADRNRARRGELCFGTVDSFLVWHLTKGTHHVTDATNASRTQLFDLSLIHI